jgi:hypothetical protein
MTLARDVSSLLTEAVVQLGPVRLWLMASLQNAPYPLSQTALRLSNVLVAKGPQSIGDLAAN